MGTRKATVINSLNHAEDINTSTYGIYAYLDKDNKPIYIGKDSNIDKNVRHGYHCAPSKRMEQGINQLLQSENGHNWISYVVIAKCSTEQEMSNLEVMYIMYYKAMGYCKYNNGIDMNKDVIKDLGFKIVDLAKSDELVTI